MIKPIKKYILAKPHVTPQKGLLLSVKEEKNWIYEVVDVGSEVKDIKVGNKVLCVPFRENEIEDEGEKFILIQEEIVIGIYE